MFDALNPSDPKPNLLFLSHRLPFPPDKGERIRAFRILQHLAPHFRIHLGCFVSDPAELTNVRRLAEYCVAVKGVPLAPQRVPVRAVSGLISGDPLTVASFANAEMSAWVAEQLSRVKPEIIFVFSSTMAQYILRRDRGEARFIMDFVDVDSDKWRQYAAKSSFLMKWVYAREARKLLAFDRKVAAEADASLFVSDAEADLFRNLSPETAETTHAVANGIDCAFFSPTQLFSDEAVGRTYLAGPGPHMVFTGTMDYWPNVDAVSWFADEIFPLVRGAAPQATFTIVGSNPNRAVCALGNRSGISVTGRVPDVRPYLAAAHVVVAPLRLARGIQNKILEGMAMAKPVVTTSHGLEGIRAEPERHLLVADTAAQFSQAVLRAAGAQARTLGPKARRLMEDSYGWPARLAALDRLVR
jgi:sugar transferase (PEP-CTERM/EpsH1 system associated)